MTFEQSKIRNPKSKILLLTHRFPYPPDKGDRIRGFHWLKSLASRHDLDLLTLTQDSVPDLFVREVKQFARNVYLYNPDPSSRWRRLAKGLLTGKSLTESYFGSPAVTDGLKRLFTENSYDLCLAVCSSMGAVALSAGRVQRLIVDLVDVDSAKWRWYGKHHRGLGRWIFNRESRKIARLERRLTQHAELTTTVSRRECELLRKIAPAAPCLAIPNGVDTDYFLPSPNARSVDRIAFVGQMDYFPNVDAVLWFAHNIWGPISARHPQLRWNIVGRNPTRAVQKLSRLPNVTVTGAVPDVRPFMASALCVAPLRIACGVQNKVLEALACGRPVVTNSAVAEGLDVHPQEELLIAEKPDEWIGALDLLLRDQTLQTQLGARARQAMIDRFSWNAVMQKMRDCVSEERSTDRDELPLLTKE